MAEPIEPDRETRREAGSAKRLERTRGRALRYLSCTTDSRVALARLARALCRSEVRVKGHHHTALSVMCCRIRVINIYSNCACNISTEIITTSG